ncbi:HD domain-containing protein [Luteipulveratus halotolerans]|uniref:Metal-dependent phosphohydrolase n=1 Tax=Luteipulveratus halotolerans TaxID=1631356 RepID=A0A0L6CGK3_9MICO|nr:hypothetical protein [Luteipulveratus halotolerans]KNX36849.1 hypothetical protein VV01_06315 [Luteipulveratus halotolerans]
MTDAADRVRRRWPLGDGVALRERVIAAYEQPWRRYHDVRHLDEVLARITEIGSEATDLGVDQPVVTLAAYFHDVVYATGSATHVSNEEASARCAEAWLSSAGLSRATVSEVARLVRGTADHDSDPTDVSAAVLYDADLAILATAPERYAEYAADVRREYAAVPDPDFAAGRARVLASLLERPNVFATAYGQDRWEHAARANLRAELSVLRHS